MNLSSLFIYLLTGLVAGLLSGLFGIGGGLVIVPLCLIVFSLNGFPADILMASAVATSLATIVITGASSARQHHKQQNVQWPVVAILTPALLASTLLGSLTVTHVASQSMQLAFACFTALLSVYMWFSPQPKSTLRQHSWGLLSVGGVVIGYISAMFGIGGGTLSVPFLHKIGLDMKKAIGTSAAIGLPIAFFSTIYYGIQSNSMSQEYQVGFIYLPAVIGIVLVSPFTAKLGAKWVQTLDKHKLKKAFALLLAVVSIKLVIEAIN